MEIRPHRTQARREKRVMRRHIQSFLGVGASLAAQQGLNALAGILIVRSMSREDYSVYSVALTSVGGITVLAEAGVIASILSIGGRLSTAEQRGSLYSFARSFRWASLVIAALLFSPAVVLLLLGTGAAWPAWFTVFTMVLLAASTASTSAMYGAIYRLESRFGPVNVILATSAAVRLGVIALAATFWAEAASPAALIALTAACSAFEAVLLHRRLPRVRAGESNPTWPREFRRNAFRQVPSSAYYVAQSIVLPFVLVSAGQPLIIADISALSRYALVFSVAALAISQFLTPRLATSTGRRVGTTYLLGVVGYVFAGLILAILISLLRDPLLMLLGSHYTNLGSELIVVSIGASIAALASLLVALNQTRAWLRLSWLQIPLSCAWILGMLAFLPMTTPAGAALFYALTPIPALCTLIICAIVGWRGDSEPRMQRERG